MKLAEIPKNVTWLQSNSTLILILSGTVLLRIGAALFLGGSLDQLPGIYDEISYHSLALRILAGKGYSFGENWYPFTLADTPTAHWSFLYPLYLVGVYRLLGINILAARVAQAVSGGLLMGGLIFRIGERLGGRRIGLMSAALFGLYGYWIYYNAALMTETFFSLALLIALDCALALKEKQTFQTWVLLGLAMGAAALLRQTALFVIPLLLGWLIYQLRRKIHWRGLAIAVILPIILIAPVTLRNFRVYGQFLLLNSNSGYAWYASVNPGLGTRWDASKVVVPVPDELSGLNEAQLDHELSQRAWQTVVHEPARIAILTFSKAMDQLRFWPSPQSGWLSNLMRVLSFGIYLPFMLAGLILSLRRWHDYLPIYAIVIILNVVHMLTWPAARYRLPADAMMMILAALAVVALYDCLTARMRRNPVVL